MPGSSYLPDCLPPCAGWKIGLSGHLRRPPAGGPKRAVSVGVGGRLRRAGFSACLDGLEKSS